MKTLGFSFYAIFYLSLNIIDVKAAESNRTPTIVVLGRVGVGKSSLANIILGRAANYSTKGEVLKCFNVGVNVKNQKQPFTEDTCMKFGKFEGGSELELKVFDTPGVTVDSGVEWFNRLVQTLNKTVINITAFAVIHNHLDTKFQTDNHFLWNVLEKGLGETFWDNVIVIVSKHSTSKSSVPTPAVIKKKLLYLTTDFKTKVIPKVFYIDSFYSATKPQEKHVFKTAMLNLKNKIKTLQVSPYSLKLAQQLSDTSLLSQMALIWLRYVTTENTLYFGVTFGVLTFSLATLFIILKCKTCLAKAKVPTNYDTNEMIMEGVEELK